MEKCTKCSKKLQGTVVAALGMLFCSESCASTLIGLDVADLFEEVNIDELV